MSSSFDLVSHPDRTLEEHLASCDVISARMLEFKHTSLAFFPKSELEAIRRLLIFFHDFGKGTDFFQAKILDATEREGVPEFLARQTGYIQFFKKNKLSKAKEEMENHGYLQLDNHAKMGAYWLFSQWRHVDPVVEAIVLRVVRRHHGFLTNFLKSKGGDLQVKLDGIADFSIEQLEKQQVFFNFDGYNKILSRFKWEAQPDAWLQVRKKFEDFDYMENLEDGQHSNKNARYFLLQHYLFSLLLSADKGDMMLDRHLDKTTLLKPKRLIPAGVVDEHKLKIFENKPQKPIDHLREEAYQFIARNCERHGDGNFFSITLPTGFGKTFSAYNAAFLLQNKFETATGGAVPRIIYALPFTSVIDQNDEVLRAIFDKCGGEEINASWITRNHYLSLPNERYDEQELRNDEPEYLAEGWEQEVIVTTFVQLLGGIFTNRNRPLRKFHNMTNAVILLDEVQNVPAKYFEAIELVFKAMAEHFNTKFIFITATQPFLFAKEEDVLELTDPEKVLTKGYFENLDRIRLDQSLLKKYGYEEAPLEELLDIFMNDIEGNPEKSFLLIFNTIAYSQEVFKKLKEAFEETHCLLYLSASILPKRRRQLIRLIMRKGKPRIVVSTQVVEAGVDIDLDVVYRDFAPMDSINQAAGRCNRNAAKGQGEVKLFNSGKARRIYDGVLLDATLAILKQQKENVIPESRFYELNRQYAQQVRIDKAVDASASAKLKEAIFKLNLEDLADNFKLIDQDYPQYNVFIPYYRRARMIWAKYQATSEIKDFFEKKRAIKRLQPELMQFVTRFPKTKYNPGTNHKDDFIIYEPDWKNWYDLETGFRFKDFGDTIMLF